MQEGGKSSYRTQIFHRVNTFSIQNFPILEKTMDFGRNSNRRFAVKNKEIKQIIFSQKKNKKEKKGKGRKKWIIVALVLALALGGGSVAAVVILHRNVNRSEFSMPGNMAGLTFTEDMTAASGVTNVGITEASFDVASLQSAVTRAEEELQDAEDEIAEYESYVNDGSYKSYFKVDEYQAIYDENLKALTDKLDEWGIGWSQITGGSAGSVQALKLFRELNDMGNTIVMITHDLGVAQSAKRIVRIVDGQLQE